MLLREFSNSYSARKDSKGVLKASKNQLEYLSVEKKIQKAHSDEKNEMGT